MASNMTVTGMANVPTDTMMILDLSSSMYDGSRRTTATVQTMLTSVNDSITRLQNLNANNRVGVVVYYGVVDRNQSDASNSMVLLPLDRYSGTTQYLKANIKSGRLISVAVNSGVKNAAGKTMPQTTRTVTDVAGTYAQLGILDAMNQLLNADTVVPATAAYQPGAARTPVFIFMSDGEPTAATFENGKATVTLAANQTLYIGGLTANAQYTVTEIQTGDYIPQADSHTVTLTPGQMADVTFINATRGSGNLTISKEVAHTLGSDYIIPENKAFAIHVLLEGVGVGNQTFQAVHSGGGLTAITTDREGAFTVTLRHNEVFDQPGTYHYQVLETHGGETLGSRYYLIKETNGGETVDGVTYDDTVYHAVIDVTDNGLGQLAYTVDIRTEEGTAVEEITFENNYVTPPTEPTEPPTEPENTTEPSPETGDMGIRVWLVLMLISCGAILTMAVLGKKKSPA